MPGRPWRLHAAVHNDKKHMNSARRRPEPPQACAPGCPTPTKELSSMILAAEIALTSILGACCLHAACTKKQQNHNAAACGGALPLPAAYQGFYVQKRLPGTSSTLQIRPPAPRPAPQYVTAVTTTHTTSYHKLLLLCTKVEFVVGSGCLLLCTKVEFVVGSGCRQSTGFFLQLSHDAFQRLSFAQPPVAPEGLSLKRVMG